MRLLVMRRDGVVVKEIIPVLPPPVAAELGEFWGIGFQTPNTLLCSGGYYLWKMDFNGNPTAGPVASEDLSDSFEGVTQLPNGYIAAANGYGKLRYFDFNLNRLARLDRDYTIGLGISSPTGLAWNNNTKQFLLSEPNLPGAALWTVPQTLKTKTKTVDLTTVLLPNPPEGENPHLDYWRFRQMIYVAGEIVLSYVNASRSGIPSRARIVSFDTAGNVVGYQRLFDWNLTPNQVSPGPPFSYIPPNGGGPGQYVMRSANPAYVLDFIWAVDGILSRQVSLQPTGTPGIGPAEFFNPAHPTGGQFLLFGGPGRRALVTDSMARPFLNSTSATSWVFSALRT